MIFKLTPDKISTATVRTGNLHVSTLVDVFSNGLKLFGDLATFLFSRAVNFAVVYAIPYLSIYGNNQWRDFAEGAWFFVLYQQIDARQAAGFPAALSNSRFSKHGRAGGAVKGIGRWFHEVNVVPVNRETRCFGHH
jgi:hypothetical protein